MQVHAILVLGACTFEAASAGLGGDESAAVLLSKDDNATLANAFMT